MKPVIGIISYLPDDERNREFRLKSLISLIKQCNAIFNLPVYVVIQNYHKDEWRFLASVKNVKLSRRYNKLGITGARKQLRKWFLSSKFTNLIMLDDDCQLKGDKYVGEDYIEQIQNNEECFIEFKSTLLKLFCISKNLFSKQDFSDIEAEREEGFEDTVFVKTLRLKFPDYRRVFKCKRLEELSVSTGDKHSTWYKHQDIDKMLLKTEDILRNIDK